MATIEELVIRIKADASSLEREMKRANGIVQQNTNKMGGAFGALTAQLKGLIPALSLASVVALGKSAFTAADRINDLALRTGFAGDTLSSMNVKLLQSGSSLEEFSASVSRMNNLIGEAAKGLNKEAILAFDDLGLSVEKLMALSPEEQFFAIAEALGRMENQGRQTNAAMAIFGRSAASLLPIIKETKGQLREFTEEQKKLGLALTPEQLKRIDELGDNWVLAIERMKLVILNSGIITYVTNLAHGITAISEAIKAIPSMAIHAQPGGGGRRTPTTPGISIGGTAAPASARGSNEIILTKNATKELSAAQKEAARIFDETRTAQEKYEENLKSAQKLLDSGAITLDTYNRYLQQQADILNDEVSDALDNIEEKSVETVRVLKDSFGDALEDITFDFKNFGDAASSILEAVARDLFRTQIGQPLSSSVSGAIGGLFSGGGFAQLIDNAKGYLGLNPTYGPDLPSFDVGSFDVPRDMMANIHKGEMIIPADQARAMRNGGGGRVVIYQTLHFNDAVQGAARAEIINAAPHIIAASKEAVFSSIQRGGNEARMVNRRN